MATTIKLGEGYPSNHAHSWNREETKGFKGMMNLGSLFLTFLGNYAIIYIENEERGLKMFDWDEDVEHEEVDLDEFHEALEEFLCS